MRCWIASPQWAISSARSRPSSRSEAHLASRRHRPSVTDGPLAGVPTAIKDLNATRGVRTSFGSPAFADFVPDFDDEVVRRIADAGTGEPGQDEHAGVRLALLHRARGITPGRDAVGHDADGRRLQRWSSGGRVRRTGGGRAGLRRWRLDPDPGQLLRDRRPQADARSDLRGADVRRPDRPRDQRIPRAHGARRRRVARRDGRTGGRRPVLGARGARPRSWLPATGNPVGCGSRGSASP